MVARAGTIPYKEIDRDRLRYRRTTLIRVVGRIVRDERGYG